MGLTGHAVTVTMDLMVTVNEGPNRSPKASVVVLIDGQNSLGLRHVRLRDRVKARLRTTTLDEQLAAGTSPESNILLALHAARLYRQDQRRHLAASLRAVASAAQGSRRTKAPIDRKGVRLALEELETVATRLDGDGPIDVSGIARVRTLLADGGSPFYRHCAPGVLQRELASALVSFDAPA
jgi:hypothetical protein